ncbi:MAG: cytochrome c-type biogenesis protein CcmH [Clostridia bacterium]|nr:MAG: cytochrome c-type biogenesis protein CcmH [Clostridia bacterium]
MRNRGWQRAAIAALAGVVLAVILAGSGAGRSYAAQGVDETLFKKIEANLMCTDGCGMPLATCDNATAQNMRQQIREQLAAGLTEQEIYSYMVGIYGEEVMAAPPPHVPFNLVAWVMPFLAILAGALIIYLALDRWVFDRRQAAHREPDAAEEADLEAYEGVLQREMKKYL